MARKRKVREQNNYTVTMTRDEAGSPQEVEKTVSAPTADIALDKAKQGDSQRYDNIEITKGDKPGAGRVKTEPKTTPQTKAMTEPSLLENISYPYNIGLPRGFEPLLKALTKKTKETIKINERFSRLHLTISDANSMKNLMEDLKKKSRGRSKVKNMANVVYTGIKETF